MQGSSDFGPQTDPKRSADFFASLPQEFLNSLSDDEMSRLKAYQKRKYKWLLFRVQEQWNIYGV